MSRLRSKRSTITPMKGARKNPGATRAMVTRAMAPSGCEEIDAASEVIAKNPTQSPSAEMTWTLKSAKKRRVPNTRSIQPPSGTGSAPGSPASTTS